MYRNNFLSGVLAPPRTSNLEDDEFDGPALNPKWTESGSPAVKSFSDKIPSALWLQYSTSGQDSTYKQDYSNAGNFSLTLCGAIQRTANFHNMTLWILDSGGGSQNGVGIQMLYTSGVFIRTLKYVTGTFSQVDISGALNELEWPRTLMHIQRSGNNWDLYYSNNGVSWIKFSTTIALTFTVTKFQIQVGTSGGTTKTQAVIDWIRRDWITL